VKVFDSGGESEANEEEVGKIRETINGRDGCDGCVVLRSRQDDFVDKKRGKS